MEQPQHESAYGAIAIGETGDVRGLVQEEPKSGRRWNLHLVSAAVGLAAVLGVTGVLVTDGRVRLTSVGCTSTPRTLTAALYRCNTMWWGGIRARGYCACVSPKVSRAN